jgi:enoyl-CoA hydratase/carnithine racemase
VSAAVRYERRGPAAWLTIDRPEAHNALSSAVRAGLHDGFARFAGDDASVLILTGAGSKAFCAGGDLKELTETGLRVPPADYVPHLGRTVELDRPVIAAVNGIAYGGGFMLAQMCDLCVAADHARFAITEARWGRGAPWAAPLPWLIPPRVALELLLTGDPIDAGRAREVGLVNRVVAAERLHDEAQAVAERIATNAPLSVRAGKAMVYAAAERARSDAFDEAQRLFEPVYLSEDAQEGAPRVPREARARMAGALTPGHGGRRPMPGRSSSPARVDDHHVAGRPMRHAVRDAARQQSAQATHSAVADDQEIGVDLLGNADDRLYGIALTRVRGGRHTNGITEGPRSLERLLDVLARIDPPLQAIRRFLPFAA